MPAALPFDTLDYARKLEAAGVPSEQAELQARALNDALASSVASRGDLASLQNVIETRFANLDARLERKFAQVDARFENVDIRLANLESRLDAKIDASKNELELRLGGKIETLKWMFGTLVVLNGAMLVQLFLKQ